MKKNTLTEAVCSSDSIPTEEEVLELAKAELEAGAKARALNQQFMTELQKAMAEAKLGMPNKSEADSTKS